MSFDLFDRRSAERFAELLDETDGSRRHHARVQANGQLAELVALGHSLSAARPGVQVDPEFRTGLRAMLVAAAERDGIGTTATAAEPAKDQAPPVRRLFGRRIRARGAIVIGVAVGALAVSGISAASESAAPGDALYGVKRSTERAQLAMAGSDVTRGQLSLTFARNRLAEAVAMPGDDPRFRDVLDDMDADTRQGVKLLTSSAVARADKAPLDTIDTFADGQRELLDPKLGDLDAAGRQRALASIGLLDAVQQRARDLRGGLDCRASAHAGTDALGPKPRDCGGGSSGAPARGSQPGAAQPEATSGGKDGIGKKTQPATTSGTPSAAPSTATNRAVTPNASPSDGTGGNPVPLISDLPAAPAGEDGGVLDGLLGGIVKN